MWYFWLIPVKIFIFAQHLFSLATGTKIRIRILTRPEKLYTKKVVYEKKG